MGNENSDPECDALQALLNAFPSAPLDLIASAYVQAHSDQELAAEIISFSLNGIELPAKRISDSASGNRTSGNGSKIAPHDKVLCGAPPSSCHLPLPRSKGPCLPTLKEYFPSSPEKNAWVAPLSHRLQKDVSLQTQQDNSFKESQQVFCPDEFPFLERNGNKAKGERMSSSGSFQPLSPGHRSTSRASAVFGLASSARVSRRQDGAKKDSTAINTGHDSRVHIRNSDGNLIKASPTKDPVNQSTQQTSKADELSFWPTETEASLLSMLGDEFNLDIGAVRDVLGHSKGDIQKAFMVLQQSNSSFSSNEWLEREVLKPEIVSQENSSSFEHFKEIFAVGVNVERKEISSTTEVENSSVMKSYYDFEKAILKHENSSMKWVVQCLCDKYPHVDVATLLEVLRTTKFDLNDAERMLQEAGLHEISPDPEGRDPRQLAKGILESLFRKTEEEAAGNEENCKVETPKQKKERAIEVLETPKWKAVTSTELQSLEAEEDSGQREAWNVMQTNEVLNDFEMGILQKHGLRNSYGDWDEYERHQASAKQHWKTMQSYLTAATAAYAAGEFSKAELLTEKGNMYKQLSMEAKERTSKFLLEIESQQSESDFSLDLQDQHAPEALQLLRLHLKSFSSIRSCHTLTIILGCFDNPKSVHQKLKEEVVGYLEMKGYKWVEISPFCLRIQLKGSRQLPCVPEHDAKC